MTKRFNPERDHRVRQLVLRDGFSVRGAAKVMGLTVGQVAGVIWRTVHDEYTAAMLP